MSTRIKKAFTDYWELAHIWAQRSQDEGYMSGGNRYGGNPRMYFEKDIIYSYGQHFPLAIFLDAKNFGAAQSKIIAIINNDSYGVTTSKHQRAVRDAVNHYDCIYVDTDVIKELATCSRHDNWSGNWTESVKRESISHYEHIFKEKTEQASKRRKLELVNEDIGEIKYVYSQMEKLFSFIGIDIPKNYVIQMRELENKQVDILVACKDIIKKREQEKKRKERELQKQLEIKIKEALPQWLNNEQIGWEAANAMRYGDTIYMRVSGNNIETSKGALFPISDAKKIFPLLNKLRGRAFADLPTMKLGHYRVDEVHPNGDVKAGCHFVKWQQIEFVAKQLGLI